MSLKIDSEVQAIKQRFEIVGNSTKLNNAIRVAMQVAPTDMSVLITGKVVQVKNHFLKSFIVSLTENMDNSLPLTVVLFRKEP